MKEHPILFSTLMVTAILSGTKTQTRRIMNFCKKMESENYDDVEFARFQHYADGSYRAIFNTDEHPFSVVCPYGKIGDILWVRETWNKRKDILSGVEIYVHKEKHVRFKRPSAEEWKWKPSIFMPKKACRIKLVIENIRVERLWEISRDDVIAEGIEVALNATGKGSYAKLWDDINGDYSWDRNPWIWVIEFKVKEILK